jgi:Carboxypeptidase regulatory-like domain
MLARAGAIVVLATAFILATPASAQTRLNGVVRDSEGAVISGAHIVIHWDSSGSSVGLTTNVGIKQDLVVMTDANGLFSTELPPGFYDVFASVMAFSPNCQKIRIKNGEGATYKAQLKASPLVSKELGGMLLSAPK